MVLRPTRCNRTRALPLGLALGFAFGLFASLAITPAGHAAVFLTWDWDEPTVETDGSETIDLYATPLPHSAVQQLAGVHCSA